MGSNDRTVGSLGEFGLIDLIATRLRSGRTQIHVLADAAPDASFEPVTNNLEDVYFATLHQQRKAAQA